MKYQPQHQLLLQYYLTKHLKSESRLFTCYDGQAEIIHPAMKYPLHTQSKPVSGIAAKKLLEAIDSGAVVVNDRMLALAKRIAGRKAQKHG